MWVRVPGAARDFSPRVNLQCRLSYVVHTAPVCNCMTLTYICVQVKNSLTLAAIPLFGHMKIPWTYIYIGP